MRSEPSARTRRLVLERDGGRCVRCGSAHHWAGLSIHHRRLRSHPFDGMHRPSNLIALCGSGDAGCHGHVHAHPSDAYAHGWMVHAWQMPGDVAVWTRHGLVLLDDEGGWRHA